MANPNQPGSQPNKPGQGSQPGQDPKGGTPPKPGQGSGPGQSGNKPR
jgi:hypothetical protein